MAQLWESTVHIFGDLIPCFNKVKINLTTLFHKILIYLITLLGKSTTITFKTPFYLLKTLYEIL